MPSVSETVLGKETWANSRAGSGSCGGFLAGEEADPQSSKSIGVVSLKVPAIVDFEIGHSTPKEIIYSREILIRRWRELYGGRKEPNGATRLGRRLPLEWHIP